MAGPPPAAAHSFGEMHSHRLEEENRALRAELVEGFNPQSLREEYVAMRAATRAILEV